MSLPILHKHVKRNPNGELADNEEQMPDKKRR